MRDNCLDAQDEKKTLWYLTFSMLFNALFDSMYARQEPIQAVHEVD